MAYTNEMTSDEKKAVEELQMRMKNLLSSEMCEDVLYLYRFLKARNFDVEKAECMLRKHLIWRKSLQVDSILEDFKPGEFYRKFVEPSFIGFHKEEGIVQYCPLGKIDGRDVLKCVKINDYMKHWIWTCEKRMGFINRAKKGDRNYAQSIIIVDLDQLSFGNTTYRLSIESCVRLMRIFTDNFPETLKSVYVINAPGFYIIIFSIMKTAMSKELIQKIHVFGYDGWKEKLLEAIDADVLPAFLGGNRTDPDGNPLCTSFVTHGGPIPETYHLPNKERHFKDITQVKKILVPHSEKKEVCVDVTESGSLIQWEFFIKNKDIGFGLFFKVSDQEDINDVLPVQRYDTIDGTEIGHYRAQSAGIYIIVFDNSYSRISSKEVQYCITVVKPGL